MLLSAFSLGKASPAIQQFRVRRKNCPFSHGEHDIPGSPNEEEGASRRSDCAHPSGCHFGAEPVLSSGFGGGRRDHPFQEKLLGTRALLAAFLQDPGFLPVLRPFRR